MTATNLVKSTGLSSGSFSPTIGALVVVCWTGEGTGSGTVTGASLADTLNEITWTQLDFYTPFGFALAAVWYGTAVTHASRQVVISPTGSAPTPANNQVVIDQIPMTAVLQAKSNGGVSFTTTPTVTFNSTPGSTSLAYSAMLELAAQNATKPSSYGTALATNYSGSGTETISSASDENGSPVQAVQWTSAGGSYILNVAVEVSAPPPPPPPTTWNVGHIPLG